MNSTRRLPGIRQHFTRHRRSFIFAMGLVTVTFLALAIGLSTGLTHRSHSHRPGHGTTSSPPSSSPYPYPPLLNNTWQPAVNSTWQIVLQNPVALDAANTSITPNVDIFDIDLFTNPDSTIESLHKLGKKVICYFSAGSYEPDRPDSSQFLSSDMGKGLDGWPGERWLNVSSANVRNIMTARLELAAVKGCDAVDPDNVDGYVLLSSPSSALAVMFADYKAEQRKWSPTDAPRLARLSPLFISESA